MFGLENNISDGESDEEDIFENKEKKSEKETKYSQKK